MQYCSYGTRSVGFSDAVFQFLVWASGQNYTTAIQHSVHAISSIRPVGTCRKTVQKMGSLYICLNGETLIYLVNFAVCCRPLNTNGIARLLGERGVLKG